MHSDANHGTGAAIQTAHTGSFRAHIGRLVGVAFVVFLADGAFILTYLVALPTYLVDDLGLREGLAAFTFAASGTARLIAQVASGSISDRLGAGRAGAFGLALCAVALAGMSVVRAGWAFPLIALVYGAGGAVLWPAVFSAVGRALPEDERGRAAGLLALTTAVAGGVAILGGAFLVDHAGARPALVVACASVVVAACLAPAVLGGIDPRSTGLPMPAHRVEWRRLLAMMQGRSALVIVFIAQAAALGAVIPAASRYGADVLDIELHRFALLLIPAGLVAAICVTAGGAISDRVGRAPVLVVGFVAAASGFALLRMFAEPEFVPMAAAIAAGGYAMAVPALNASMMDATGGARAGLMMGWFMIAEGAGQAVGPAVGGIVLEAGGALAVLDLAVALLVVSAIFGMRISRSRAERRLAVS